jgi:hypothetical protein
MFRNLRLAGLGLVLAAFVGCDSAPPADVTNPLPPAKEAPEGMPTVPTQSKGGTPNYGKDYPGMTPAADAKGEAPKTDEPKVDAPKEEEPKVELPKTDEPKVEAPKVELPKDEPAKN